MSSTKCVHLTTKGAPCKRYVVKESKFCSSHQTKRKNTSKKKNRRKKSSLSQQKTTISINKSFEQKLNFFQDTRKIVGEVTVNFLNIQANFHVQQVEHNITSIHLLNSEDRCFEFSLLYDEHVSTLKYLLYSDDNKKNCTLPIVSSVGSWLLQVVDKLNSVHEIQKCFLDNNSYFTINDQQQSADCVYARNHHGLGYYMKRGWLVDAGSVENSILATNIKIENWTEWWSTRREMQNVECPKAHSYEMVKYYSHGIELYIPKNMHAPAIFYKGKLSDEQIRRIEAFDEKSNIQARLFYKKLLNQFRPGDTTVLKKHLFTNLRKVYTILSDDIILKQVEIDLSKMFPVGFYLPCGDMEFRGSYRDETCWRYDAQSSYFLALGKFKFFLSRVHALVSLLQETGSSDFSKVWYYWNRKGFDLNKGVLEKAEKTKIPAHDDYEEIDSRLILLAKRLNLDTLVFQLNLNEDNHIQTEILDLRKDFPVKQLNITFTSTQQNIFYSIDSFVFCNETECTLQKTK